MQTIFLPVLFLKVRFIHYYASHVEWAMFSLSMWTLGPDRGFHYGDTLFWNEDRQTAF